MSGVVAVAASSRRCRMQPKAARVPLSRVGSSLFLFLLFFLLLCSGVFACRCLGVYVFMCSGVWVLLCCVCCVGLCVVVLCGLIPEVSAQAADVHNQAKTALVENQRFYHRHSTGFASAQEQGCRGKSKNCNCGTPRFSALSRHSQHLSLHNDGPATSPKNCTEESSRSSAQFAPGLLVHTGRTCLCGKTEMSNTVSMN